jgi:hypothetical protein
MKIKILSLVALLVAGTSLLQAAESKKPNILLIVADDLGYGELSIQGNPQIPTPHIDSLAHQGVRFTSGYVSGPYCSPTRAGLQAGQASGGAVAHRAISPQHESENSAGGHERVQFPGSVEKCFHYQILLS